MCAGGGYESVRVLKFDFHPEKIPAGRREMEKSFFSPLGSPRIRDNQNMGKAPVSTNPLCLQTTKKLFFDAGSRASKIFVPSKNQEKA